MKKTKVKDTKKKTMRSRVKYPALNPKVNLKSRTEDVLDVLSYVDQLSEDEKAWMNKFMEEYNNASFDKNNENNLMKTPEEKKKSYGRNNSRNRDVYNRLRMNNDLVYLEDLNGFNDGKTTSEESDDSRGSDPED